MLNANRCPRVGSRRAEEAELERKLAEREEAALMKEKQYATLDQEVKDTKKKLKKLLNKHEVMLQTTTACETSDCERLLQEQRGPNGHSQWIAFHTVTSCSGVC